MPDWRKLGVWEAWSQLCLHAQLVEHQLPSRWICCKRLFPIFPRFFHGFPSNWVFQIARVFLSNYPVCFWVFPWFSTGFSHETLWFSRLICQKAAGFLARTLLAEQRGTVCDVGRLVRLVCVEKCLGFTWACPKITPQNGWLPYYIYELGWLIGTSMDKPISLSIVIHS